MARTTARERFNAWSVPKRIVGIVLAVAAAIGSLTGAFKGVSDTLEWWDDRNMPATTSTTRGDTEFDRTPSIGLEFWQDGSRNPMFAVSRNEIFYPIRVRMQRAAFEMLVPTAGDTSVSICAWTDDSIFILKPGLGVDEVKFFRPGTGIADYDYGSGSLFLSPDEHNSLFGTRLRKQSSEQDKAFFSHTSMRGRSDMPLRDQSGSLFLAVFIDRNQNRIVDRGEFEHVVLEF